MPSRTGANYTCEANDTTAAAVVRKEVVARGVRFYVANIRRVNGAADITLHVGSAGTGFRVRQGNRLIGPIDAGLFLTQAIGVQSEILIVYADDSDERGPSFDVIDT